MLPNFNPKTTTMSSNRSSQNDEPLIEARQALLMVSPSKGTHSFRTGYFIKSSIPSSRRQPQTLINPPPPPICHPTKPIYPIVESLSPKVHFYGWKHQLKNWNSWVERLQPSFESMWREASIYDAIMCSTLDIPRCRSSIFILAEKWNPETSTFVLPWGEVTITLEDVMALGGFSVVGDPIFSGVPSRELLQIEEGLHAVRSELLRSANKKASQQQWMEIWMGTGREFEHEAFLVMWLSRYVLPADDNGTINKRVFQIAVLLSRGNRIALAPAVLASIYRDLRLLKEKITALRGLGDQVDGNVSRLNLTAPLYLLQAWFWERFPDSSREPNPVPVGLCRLERWHKVKVSRYYEVGFAIDSARDEFRWRPYSTPLNDWSFDLDLQSFGICIRDSQLIGLDCMERYFPHRVAMQFGLNQDIPVASFCLYDTMENAWRDYSKPIVDIELFVPPKNFESAVTTRYLDWWWKAEAVKEGSSYEIKKKCFPKMLDSVPERMKRFIIKENEAEVPPGFGPTAKRVPEEVDDSFDQHQPSSKRTRQSPRYSAINVDSSESDAPPVSSSQDKGARTVVVSDDDHQTLTELSGVKDSKGENGSGALSASHRESPPSSAGDNSFVQEITSTENYTGDILPTEECTRKEITTEDGSESKVESLIRRLITQDKNEVQTSFNDACELSDIILDRMDKLQRVFDIVKADKGSQNQPDQEAKSGNSDF